MPALHYKLTSFSSFLQQLAPLFGTGVEGNTLIIPTRYGNGFFKTLTFNEGLEALIYQVQLREELLLSRQTTKDEFYILTFEETDVADSADVQIDADEPMQHGGRKTAIYLTSFLFNVAHTLKKDAPIKGVRVILTESWMKKYLQLAQNEDVLEEYIKLKNLGVWQMPVDAALTDLLTDLISDKETPLLFYQNKLMLIIERFFSWLYAEKELLKNRAGISRHSIEQAQMAEAILTNDITVVPPTIKKLAYTVATSPSKLKKVFKTVYGLPPYQYYQKQRMQKAKVLLLTGNHSVKDVGYTLGYTNLSNFTLAFKKEFGLLPSNVKRKVD